MAFPRLNVRIIQANDLLEDADGHCDPYCELQLGETCFKTPTKWRTSNPVWGKYYTFPVSNPNAQFLELRFFDYDLLKKDAWLGCLSIRLDQLQKGVAVTKTFPLQQVAQGSITLELCAIDFGQLCAPVHHAAFIAPPFIQQQQPFIPVATTGIYPTPGLPYQQQVPSPSPVIIQDQHHHHHFHEHHHKDDKHHFFHRHESSPMMDNKATKKNKMTDNGYSHYQDVMNSSSSSAPYPMAAAPFSQMNLPNQAPPGAYSYPPSAMNPPMNPNVPPTVITTSTTTTKATHSTDQKDKKKKEKTTEKCKSNQWNQTQSGYSVPPLTDYYRQPSIPPPPPFQNPMYNQQQYPGNNNYMPPPPPPPPPQQQYPGTVPHFPYPAPDYNYHYQQHQQQHQQNQQSSKAFESKSFESKKKECTCQSNNSPPDSLLHHLHLQQQKKASFQQYGSTAGLPYPTNLPPMPPIV